MTPMTKIRNLALLAAVGALAAVACQAPAPAPSAAPAPPDYEAELKPIFATFIEVLNTADYAKLDGVFADNFQRVAPDQNANGPEEMEALIRQIHAAYKDFQIVIGESAYFDGLSFAQWTVTGTATGEDGSEVAIEIPGLTMCRYAGGKITEEWVYYDTAPSKEQLGTPDLPHTE